MNRLRNVGTAHPLLAQFKETRLGMALREWRFLNSRSSEISFYRQFMHMEDLVFDVGANIGNKTAVYRSLGARVICFEPQSLMCEKLERRFRHDSRVAIERVALGASSGQGTIFVCSDLPEISTLVESGLTKGRFAEKLQNASTQVIEAERVNDFETPGCINLVSKDCVFSWWRSPVLVG